MISSIMLHEMDKSQFKLHFTDLPGAKHHNGGMVVYVDDAGLMINNFEDGHGILAV